MCESKFRREKSTHFGIIDVFIQDRPWKTTFSSDQKIECKNTIFYRIRKWQKCSWKNYLNYNRKYFNFKFAWICAYWPRIICFQQAEQTFHENLNSAEIMQNLQHKSCAFCKLNTKCSILFHSSNKAQTIANHIVSKPHVWQVILFFYKFMRTINVGFEKTKKKMDLKGFIRAWTIVFEKKREVYAYFESVEAAVRSDKGCWKICSAIRIGFIHRVHTE